MSDEKPVPETLETIAAKISGLETRLTKEIAEAKAQLGVKIEAVDEKVTRVYDELIAQRLPSA